MAVPTGTQTKRSSHGIPNIASKIAPDPLSNGDRQQPQGFYREAGDPSPPTIVLLHGLPTSSQMFRELIPALADQFQLIAPDYIGFGHSDAPSSKDFEYTFDNLAAHVRGLLDQLGLTSYILYMQDYGGPGSAFSLRSQNR